MEFSVITCLFEKFTRPKPQFLSRHKVTRWTASFSGKAICFLPPLCLPIPFRRRRCGVFEWRHLLQQRHRGLAQGLNHSHGNAQSWVLADKHKHSPYREAQAWRDYSLTAPTDWRPRHWRRAGNRQRVRRGKKKCPFAVARLPSIVRDKMFCWDRICHGWHRGRQKVRCQKQLVIHSGLHLIVKNKVISLLIWMFKPENQLENAWEWEEGVHIRVDIPSRDTWTAQKL